MPIPPVDWWSSHQPGPIRHESHYGSRIVRCFERRPASVHAMLESSVQRFGARDALILGPRRWTYQQVDHEVNRLALGFAGLGIVAGDRVALFIGNRAEFIFVLFALQRLGVITVPIGIREQRAGLAYMLTQCGATAVVFDEALAERIPDHHDAACVRHRLAIDSPDWSSLLRAGDEALVRPLPSPHRPAEDDTACILYTSGTTGRPKGAMLTHLSFAHSVRHFEVCMRLTENDCGALAVPASHVTGLVGLLLNMVHVGGRLLVLPEFKAATYLPQAAAERVSFSILVPAMYQLCLMQPDFGDHDLSAWRIAGYGGAPMPAATVEELARRLPQMILVNAYGATETTSPTTSMPLGHGRERADSIGVPVPCADVIIVDDHGVEVPRGESGELWIGGPMVVSGYWDNPVATADSFTAGYWHSGDIGQIDEQGFVRLFDRKKDMLNRGGFKIYSVEVENTLVGFDGIVEAAVIGRPCPVLGERVHAFVHAEGRPLSVERLRQHCAALLADYKVPETFTVSTAPLPRNANGKLLKRLMRDQLLADSTD